MNNIDIKSNGISQTHQTKDSDQDNKLDDTSLIDKPIGLSNQGATCYINSLLQTLFMTHEFRSSIYQWLYDEKIHGKKEDCIPFQLQKLFAKLQMKQNLYVQTKDLTKSFQWEHQQSLEQQDIQEFCIVLFDAIEQSVKGTSMEFFIRELFETTSVNYIKCSLCGYESSRLENLLNIQLTVKNKIDKIYNDSLEKALQIYLKPEKLENNNQYFCEICQTKVNAIKGTKFMKLPKLLCFILNRFSFNYITLQREKLDDFVSFPQILNMNNYINGYDGIKNKLNDEMNIEYFNEEALKMNWKISSKALATKTSNEVQNSSKTLKSAITTTTTKKKIIPGQANSSLRDIKKKALEKKKENKNNFDIVVCSKISGQTYNNVYNEEPIDIEANDRKLIFLNNQFKEKKYYNLIETYSSTNSTDFKDFSSALNFSNHKIEGNISQDRDILNPNDNIGNDVKDKSLINDDINGNNSNHSGENHTNDELKAKIKGQEEPQNNYEKKRADLIQQYLKDGPLVYELYSILVHSGGANGGHYSTFTKSIEDNKWYNFNDSTVRPIDYKDIPNHTFGGVTYKENAYMLFYKQIDSVEDKTIQIHENAIPNYIKNICEEEDKQFLIEGIKSVDRQKQMNLKVYYKLEVKYIKTSLKETLNELLEKALEAFNLKDIDRKYVRLRSYVPFTDSLTDTYTNRENQTLEDLKIYSTKSLAIEIRNEGEEFVEYCEERIYFKIVLWRDELNELDEISLKPQKVWVNKNAVFSDLLNAISHQFHIPFNKLRLLRKVNLHGIQTAEIISTPDKFDKSLVSCRLFENMMLYIEEIEKENGRSKWDQEFEKETYRYKIKFNNPFQDDNITNSTNAIEYPYTVSIDCRNKLSELKKSMCEILKIDLNHIIMKRAGKNGVEIKDLDKTLQTGNFVNPSSIFLEFGTPSLPGHCRLYFSLAILLNPLTDSVSHKFQELFELSLSGDLKASQVKEIVSEKLKVLKNMDIDPKLMRLRERVSDTMIKVIRDIPLKNQGIVEKKQVAIELLDHEEKIAQNEALILIRLWNPQTLELSDITEITIDSNETLRTLAQKIFEKNKDIPIENMEGCRIVTTGNFHRNDLLTQDWFSLNDEENLLYSHPFYISNDGFTIFVKDRNIVSNFTEEDKKKLGILNRKGHKNMSYNQPAEKALKITVKKLDDDKGQNLGKIDNLVSENVKSLKSLLSPLQQFYLNKSRQQTAQSYLSLRGFNKFQNENNHYN